MSFEFLLPYEATPHVYLIKAEEPTNPQFGFSPDNRPIQHHINMGIVNVDKPQGPTSHEVASWVKKLFDLSKTGHGGTLDPQVTGVLPIALGRATKVIRALLTAGKEYICVMYLHEEVSKERIESALRLYTTSLYQRPPLKSSVARRLRIRKIYYTQLLEVRNKFVLFRVGCEAGTYIRKLCYDIGESLLCGAHMVELRRTRTGDFREDTLCTLQDLHDALTIFREENNERYLRALITPMEKAVKHWKKIYIRDSAVDAIAHGASLAVAGVLYLEKSIEKGDSVAIMTQKGELVAFAVSLMTTHQILKASHGICAKTQKVFMPRGWYPNWQETKIKENP
ncbi:MAG: RNA-guided pseudouridylation complex pseudouridine synthase subunit Cbf5 [Promethearchaeota archaeon]